MIHSFAYSRASSVEEADRQLAAPGAQPLGGGTDLMVCIREELSRPDTLVDLTRARGAGEIVERADGGLRIGGSARLAQIARHPLVCDRFAALAQACESVGTPALRTMG